MSSGTWWPDILASPRPADRGRIILETPPEWDAKTEREYKIEGLSKALLDGERSGDVGELDMRKIKSMARRGAKSGS